MSKLTVNPTVLGIGALVVAMTGSSALAGGQDCDSTASTMDDSLLTIAGAHGDGDEGECGEKDEEGKCGEGQCGEEDGDGEDEESDEEEA
ncbi:MAG: low-complexity protein [Gammaproteobacteria bacterium]|nr:low-complexity protein [Gammaproteobacteria bacterium]